jgi:hypothetical protein
MPSTLGQVRAPDPVGLAFQREDGEVGPKAHTYLARYYAICESQLKSRSNRNQASHGTDTTLPGTWRSLAGSKLFESPALALLLCGSLENRRGSLY